MFYKRILPLILIIFFLLSILATVTPKSASALSGSEFQAGRIIDDSKFFAGSTMSVSDIQNFLNAKVPVCDTWGTQPYAGTTRAAYSASRGVSTPFICLKDYHMSIPSKSAEPGLCNGITASGAYASEVIAWVAQSCGINPQVLIVLLQKEQSLVTDDWPWPIQYRSATGYGCPDTAVCDSEYYGFFNQVYNAARQFKRYIRDAHLFNYSAGRYNYIQYNPNAGCGGSNVYIENNATAALYNYTPYQPNASALANLYGTGDGCGAYGNRNFWRLFNDWFGSTYSNCIFPSSTTNSLYRLYNKGTGNHLITESPAEVCAATSIGYLYDGQIFSSQSGQGRPVYRLERGGRYLLTDSVLEKDVAVSQHGFRLEGVGFIGVDPSINPSEARPVYRLSSIAGTYVYTISEYERDALSSYGYRYEGVSFYVKENSGISISPVYRLSHPQGMYLFTMSAQEKDNASQHYNYQYEGVAWNGVTQMNPTMMPVYRLASKNGYVLTTSLLERLIAIQMGYRDEGIGLFTYGTMQDANLNKNYRLARESGAYLYTTSTEERNTAVSNYGYRLEGISFLTP